MVLVNQIPSKIWLYLLILPGIAGLAAALGLSVSVKRVCKELLVRDEEQSRLLLEC